MTAATLACLALMQSVALVVLARRLLLIRSLQRSRAALRDEATEALDAGFRHQHNRCAWAIEALDRRIERALVAPLWRWTP